MHSTIALLMPEHQTVYSRTTEMGLTLTGLWQTLYEVRYMKLHVTTAWLIVRVQDGD